MTVEVVLLGAAQDGGVPQAGCGCAMCSLANIDPNKKQFVSSLGIIDREHESFWIIDATPDFREQLHLLLVHAPECSLKGIFITHAHMGHYTGLIHLGREAMNTNNLPVYCTPKLGSFLKTNAPWKQLVEIGNIELETMEYDVPVTLTPNLKLVPVAVPHRGEYSDTVGYLIQGPRKKLFFCPDIDSWSKVEFDLAAFFQEIDIALVDGSFFDSDELPGRDMNEIPHPLVKDSVELFREVQSDIFFIHQNHTNPLWGGGLERKWLEKKGYAVGEQGRRWEI